MKGGSIDVVISTVPPSSEFRLPSHLVKASMVIVELVYFPRETALVKQANAVGCCLVEGSEILFEQGTHQFQIWTDLDPPRQAMAAALVNVHDNGKLQDRTPLLFLEALQNKPHL